MTTSVRAKMRRSQRSGMCLRARGPEVSAHQKAHGQQQRHAQVGITLAVILHEGEDSHRCQQCTDRGTLGLVLAHAREPDQRGNEQNAAANTHHAGYHADYRAHQQHHPGHKNLPQSAAESCRARSKRKPSGCGYMLRVVFAARRSGFNYTDTLPNSSNVCNLFALIAVVCI